MIIQNYIEKIAKCSKPAEGVTRLPFTKEHKSANNLLKQWMSDAGLKISLDAAASKLIFNPASLIHCFKRLFADLCSLVKGNLVTPSAGFEHFAIFSI